MFHNSYLNKLIELVNVINTLHNNKLIVNIIGININNPLLQLVSYAPCCLQYNITRTCRKKGIVAFIYIAWFRQTQKVLNFLSFYSYYLLSTLLLVVNTKVRVWCDFFLKLESPSFFLSFRTSFLFGLALMSMTFLGLGFRTTFFWSGLGAILLATTTPPLATVGEPATLAQACFYNSIKKPVIIW